jgi:L,D-peptidoglycan transpeptidase YkuD (ErfK/YbiS/YcfS/YnhG family)
LGTMRFLVLAALVGVVVAAVWYSVTRENGRLPAEIGQMLQTRARLVLVETGSFDGSDATLSTFEREPGSGTWRKVDQDVAAKVGRAGVGWGEMFQGLAKPGEPIKREGDKRAPVGVFPLSRPFGFLPSNLPGYMQLEAGRHFCVDDAGSEDYGRIVSAEAAKDGTSGERMWEIDIYRRGMVVDYAASRDAKSGSCIFVHVWKSPDTPTVGCVAAAEETVERLQKWAADSAEGAYIAIVPRAAKGRLGLGLPEG